MKIYYKYNRQTREYNKLQGFKNIGNIYESLLQGVTRDNYKSYDKMFNKRVGQIKTKYGLVHANKNKYV